MHHDRDFAAYMVARWPALVRTLVLLGCGQPHAEEVVQRSLSRCYLDWRRVRESDDIDVQVYRSVLDTLARDSRDRADMTDTADDGPEPDRTDAELVRDALLEALDGLDDQRRRVVVLRYAAGLDERQVGDLLELQVEVVEVTLADALERLDMPAVWGASR
ncbi:sigma factor-like helix-turn-helix DNA-binding protein [Nocardioides ungokensis]